MTLTHTCVECGRTFDMWNAEDAIEWANGHDCEPAPRDTAADILRRVLRESDARTGQAPIVEQPTPETLAARAAQDSQD